MTDTCCFCGQPETPDRPLIQDQPCPFQVEIYANHENRPHHEDCFEKCRREV